MIEDISLAFQGAVLVMLAVTTWRIWQMRKLTQRTNDLVGQYRREIGWLTERVDMLETTSKQSQRATSSK